MISRLTLLAIVALLVLGVSETPARAANGQLELTIVDKDTGKPIACRMHLIGPNHKPFRPRGTICWNDHFVIPGTILLKLPLGDYTFVIERGLEYLDLTGQFRIDHFANDSKKFELRRFINMAHDGWWSGDFDVRRSVRDIELLMEAEDLHVAEVITWQNNKDAWKGKLPQDTVVRFDNNRYCQVMAGMARQAGTELLVFGLPTPLSLPPATAEYPPLVQSLVAAREKNTLWVDASKPFWWDLPMLIAAGQIDSIELAHSHICRDTTINNEANGKPRDAQRYASHLGNAQWSQELYFRLLDCGLHIPPSAGSGSGDSPNPLGQNRVYVHVDGDFTLEQWWQNLRAGQVVVTNGPLLQPTVEGKLPGHVFQAEKGTKLELQPVVSIFTREPITYLEIVRDGRVDQEIRFDDYTKTGMLPRLSFERSGWFLVRAVTNASQTYRFAMTGPYYVEIGGQRRISKQAAQFFLDWVVERARQLNPAKPEQRREVIDWHRKARDFWQDLVSRANVE